MNLYTHGRTLHINRYKLRIGDLDENGKPEFMKCKICNRLFNKGTIIQHCKAHKVKKK